MRSPIDLVELPFAFTQRSLLTESAFIREAEKRHVRLRPATLEALHRLKLLVPLLRFSRDRAAILRAAKTNAPFLYELTDVEFTESWSLAEIHRRRRLHDGQRFIQRSRLERRAGDREYRASMYLYSPHQLIQLQRLATLIPYITYKDDRAVGLQQGRQWLHFEQDIAEADRQVAIAAAAFETGYLPRVTGTLRFSFNEQFEQYDQWRAGSHAQTTLDWLKLEPAWLRDTADNLLHRADRHDPMADWFDVVREGDPRYWQKLKGTALSAIDVRTCAEMFLLAYEELVREGSAEPLPVPTANRFGRTGFENRLRPKRARNETLTRFGLSPHPKLILVLEGASEALVVPRVMRQLRINIDEDYISIVDAEGVKKNIDALVAYAVAPRGTMEGDGRYLSLSRPPTRLLQAMDAEGPLATEEGRARRREIWIERIMRTLPPKQDTPTMREAVSRLVHLEVWTTNGDSFEFAHFTDREIAKTINKLDESPRRPSYERLVGVVADTRARRGPLDPLLRMSKPEFANALWPMLETKIERALARGTEHRIPVVRVLIRAVDLASEWPRGGFAIPIVD